MQVVGPEFLSTPAWMKPHVHDLRNAWGRYKTYRWLFETVVGIYVVAVVLMMAVATFKVFVAVPAVTDTSLGAYLYIQLHLIRNTGVAFVGLIAALFSWLFLFAAVFVLWGFRVVVDFLYYRLFRMATSDYLRERVWYSKVVSRLWGRKLRRGTVIVGGFLLITALLDISRFNRFDSTVTFFTASVIVLAVAFFGHTTFLFLRTRATMGHSERFQRLESHLFSLEAMRHSLKSVLVAVFSLSMIGWFLIPSIFGVVAWYESVAQNAILSIADYSRKYEILLEEGLNEDRNPGLWAPIRLATPESIEAGLLISNFEMTLRDRRQLARFQGGMFYVATVVMLGGVGLPALWMSVAKKGSRQTMLEAARAVVISAAIVGGLKITLAWVFVIDSGQVFGPETVFMLVVSFHLVSQRQLRRDSARAEH